ncbi:ATP-binding protein [Meiothermus cerbereus]|uniref:ATP-binding protein n=1 Tax=Meiothermus cerbereus TaxID=65552 RepID=UPI003EED5572
MPPACLYLLDEPHVRVGEVRLELTPSRPAYLLVYLACQGAWVKRNSLADLLWPESPEEEARHNLRVNLHRARSLPWATGLEVERDRLRFPIETDVAQFRAALGRADWAAAVRLHRRPFLQDFPWQNTPALEDWAALERESLLEAWQNAAQRHAEALQQAQQHPEASLMLAEILRHNLLAEDVLQNYMRAAYLAGQREAALRLYERFVQELKHELGLEPMQATQELAASLRRAEPLQAVAPKPPPRIPLEVLRPPRLVGREAEQARLRDSTALLVHGEPGVGKTRLLQEVFPDSPLLRCREGLENVPFYPVLEYLKAHLEALPDLGHYREDLARLLPEVYPGFTPPPAEPSSAKARLLEALARALAPAGRLLFDDLQWADESTLELLLYLHSRGQPWTGAYRTHEVGPALAKAREALRSSGAAELALEPLGANAVQTLLADLIGTPQGPRLFSSWLHGQTGGNPFFALETLKALFENGVLRAEGGQWHTDLDEITQDYSELQIPPRVAEVVRRRVGRLSEPAQRVVQAASVVGEGFSPKLLAGVTGLSEWAVLEGVEEAEQGGIVVGERFVHDVLKQGIYRELSPTRCKLLHARVAEHLGGQADPQVVAEHWFRAASLSEAVRYWLLGAQTYMSASFLEEAIRVLERALPYAVGERQIEVLTQLAQANRELGRHGQAQAYVNQVLQSSPPLLWKTHVLVEEAWILLAQGKLEEALLAVEEGERCLQHLEPQPLEEGSLELALSKLRSNLAFRQGDFATSARILEPLLDRLRSHGPSVALAGVLVSLGGAYDNQGDEPRAIPVLKEALEVAQSVGARYYQVDAANNLLACLIRLGRTNEGLAEAAAALALGEYEGSEFLRNNLAVAYLSLGREPEAMQLFQQIAHQATDTMLRALAWGRLGELYSRHGLHAEAEDALNRALDNALGMDPEAAPVRLALVLLRQGTETQLRRARPILQAVNVENLPLPFREQYEQALNQRGFPLRNR